MLHARSLGARTFAFILTAVTLFAAVPVHVHHHADHNNEAIHLEHDHGGHGGLIEQDEAKVPSPHAPVAFSTVALRIPDVEEGRTSALPASDDFLSPLERAPPTDLPRAPPTPS